MIGRTIGHHQITEEPGNGGMGGVHRAQAAHLRHDVAVKALPPGSLTCGEARRRFWKEGMTLCTRGYLSLDAIFCAMVTRFGRS